MEKDDDADGQLWRRAGGGPLLWQEICEASIHNGAEQSIVAQLLGNVLRDNQASLSEAMALLHILFMNPCSSSSLNPIKLPSPTESPAAFIRLHASKLNAYDIDDVLDNLREALAKENVYLNRCLIYLRKKLEELAESSYEKKKANSDYHSVKNMKGNNDVLKTSKSTAEKGQPFPNPKTIEKKPTFPDTSTMDKRPSVPITSTMGKRPALPEISTMDRRPPLPNTSTMDKRTALPNTSTMDKKPTLHSSGTPSIIDKRPTSLHTRTMDTRPTFSKRTDQNTDLKDNTVERNLGNVGPVTKSKVLEEKRPNLERFPPPQLSRKLSDKSKVSTMQTLRVHKVPSTNVISTKGNIIPLVHTKKKSMP